MPRKKTQEDTPQSALAILDDLLAQDPDRPLRHTLAGPYVRLGRHKPPIALQIGVDSEGSLRCTGLLIGWQLDVIGDPTKFPILDRKTLTARAVHSLNLGALLDALAPLSLDEGAEPTSARRDDIVPIPDWVQKMAQEARPRPKSDEERLQRLRGIVNLRQEARKTRPNDPMSFLHEQTQLSKPHLYRLLNEAKKLGITPDQPDESSTKSKTTPRRRRTR